MASASTGGKIRATGGGVFENVQCAFVEDWHYSLVVYNYRESLEADNADAAGFQCQFHALHLEFNHSYLDSASDTETRATRTRCHPFAYSSIRANPRPLRRDGSVWIAISSDGSKGFNTLGEIKAVEGDSISQREVAATLMSAEKLAIFSTIPINRRILVMFVGEVKLEMASSFTGSAAIPSALITHLAQRYIIYELLNFEK
ncbi:hypothetical protein OUZ56_012371 [Daphnia magna]|uniref:Uncharacterized protein n=1 Tax=Daphnia magna TaxID=35525 RepID=A0ABQ9Z2Y3_9CRUS|nr:hypothetical protein OUZ56_012371 [Daphnia magna]